MSAKKPADVGWDVDGLAADVEAGAVWREGADLETPHLLAGETDAVQSAIEEGEGITCRGQYVPRAVFGQGA